MKAVLRLSLMLCLALALGLGVWYWHYLVTPSPGTGEAVVLIPRGAGVRTIGELLADQGLIEADVRFLLMARFSGLASRLRAGEYMIPRGLKPLEVLHLLALGKVVLHRLTVQEGLTVEQIAALFSSRGWGGREDFITLSRDLRLIREMGLTATSLEGYLYPDTYTFSRQEFSEEFILRVMVKRFFQVWAEIEATAETQLERHQVLTLASIVEKETGSAGERPLIARVFLNRLGRGMRLQSDPTVVYGVEGFSGRITRADLRRATPYNTYVIPALPPGPICNPGRAAMEAVLQPAESGALYFVSRNDGTHVFSKTLAEHNRAVRKYQR